MRKNSPSSRRAEVLAKAQDGIWLTSKIGIISSAFGVVWLLVGNLRPEPIVAIAQFFYSPLLSTLNVISWIMLLATFFLRPEQPESDRSVTLAIMVIVSVIGFIASVDRTWIGYASSILLNLLSLIVTIGLVFSGGYADEVRLLKAFIHRQPKEVQEEQP